MTQKFRPKKKGPVRVKLSQGSQHETETWKSIKWLISVETVTAMRRPYGIKNEKS